MNSDHQEKEEQISTIAEPTPSTSDKKKKKKKKKTSSESQPETKKKVPAHIALLKKKMEEQAALEKKLKEEEEERERQLQKQEEERLQKLEEEREKKKISRAINQKNKKEREAQTKRENQLRRLGIDPTQIPDQPKKKPIYSKRKSRKGTTPNKITPKEEPSREIPENWEDAILEETSEDNSENTQEKESKDVPSDSESKDHQSMLRAPICCILGGVDSGKTTFIDKIKHTNVQVGEAGGITQKISAIWVNNKIKEYNSPGLLILDTPGHDSFHNLRHLGASICNMVILMVDITEEIQHQTLKAIELIREKKIPFVIALNKIDRLYDWKPQPNKKFKASLKEQSQSAQNHFHSQVGHIKTVFMQEGLNVELSYQNQDPKHFISMIPISSKTGESVSEILTMILKLSTQYLHKNLVFQEKKVSGIILGTEVVKGFGNCINIILSNGTLTPGDTLILESVNGAIETPVLKIITPTGKKQYQVEKVSHGTTNVKVVLQKDLDLNNLIIGSHLHFCPGNQDRSEFLDKITQKVKNEMDSLDRNISSYGISLHSRTYGALEALIDYLEEKGYPYFRTKIGIIKKLDLITCSNTNDLVKDNHYNILVAFDTDFDFDLKQVPTHTTILTGNIIYRLFEGIEEHVKKSKEALLTRQRERTIYPVKFQLIDEQHIFTNRNPMILGVKVLAGKLRIGTPIMVIKDGLPMRIGTVRGLKDKKERDIEEAEPGMEVPVKIETDLGHVVRQIKRDFDMESVMYSHLDENSSFNLRKYFWDSMEDSEHQLIVELEKLLDL